MFMLRDPKQRSRRHFFRLVATATALLPLLAARAAGATEGVMGHRQGSGRPEGSGRQFIEDGQGGGECPAGVAAACCLLRGTEILTDGGPVAIESLEIGTLVMTESGVLKPIVGIGRIDYSKAANASWDANVAPILVTQSAISAGVPERDLYLSANHSIWIDGYLIPVRHLVNGSSIVQLPTEVDIIQYYHLEFAQHEVMYAEGMAVESLQVADAETYRIFTEFRRDEGASPAAAMVPYGPVLGYAGGWREAEALARLAVYPWIDVRDRIQIVYDRLAARAEILDAGEMRYAA
jgi:hypothetical protein